MPAPGASSSYMPPAASGLSSRNGEPGIEQPVDPLPDGQLAALAVSRDRTLVATRAALGHAGLPGSEVLDEGGHRVVVRARVRAREVEPASQDGHAPRS